MRFETLDEEEVRLFGRLAEDWWDEDGEMSFLHSMSEIRMTYIRNIIFELCITAAALLKFYNC